MINYPHINPIAIEIGPLSIRWYGLSYVTGILLAWWLLKRRAKQNPQEWNEEQVSDLLFYAALGGIVGGRIGYMLFYNFAHLIENPLNLFKVWQGGMSFHGGLIGAAIGIALFCNHTKKSFFLATDFFIPAVPVGLFLGRMANFINGELWGGKTDVPWAMIFPDPLAGGVPRHPSQLYEAALEGILLFIIMWTFSAQLRPTRAVSGLFLMLYGIFRSLVEFVRQPDVQLGYLAGNWLTMGQLLSLPMIILGLILLITAYRRG